MYGKIFTQMYDGTLGTKGPWQALVTFQQMIVLADKHGAVDMTADALARRTTIPLEVIELGIAHLEQPDPQSRTPDEDGRRIVRLADDRDWGWRIVNYEHYRKIRTAEERREYHRQYQADRRAEKKAAKMSTDVNTVNNVNPKQPIAVGSKQEVEAEVETAGADGASAAGSAYHELRTAHGELGGTAYAIAQAKAPQDILDPILAAQAERSSWYVVGRALIDMASKGVRFSQGSFEKFVRGVRDTRAERSNGQDPIAPAPWCEECIDGELVFGEGQKRGKRTHLEGCSRAPARLQEA